MAELLGFTEKPWADMRIENMIVDRSLSCSTLNGQQFPSAGYNQIQEIANAAIPGYIHFDPVSGLQTKLSIAITDIAPGPANTQLKTNASNEVIWGYDNIPLGSPNTHLVTDNTNTLVWRPNFEGYLGYANGSVTSAAVNRNFVLMQTNTASARCFQRTAQYNAGTYVYTAPYTGIYLATVIVKHTNDAGSIPDEIGVFLVRNGSNSNLSAIIESGKNESKNVINASIPVDIIAGDTFQWKFQYNSTGNQTFEFFGGLMWAE